MVKHLIGVLLAVTPGLAFGQSTEFRFGVIALSTRQNVLGSSGLIHNSGTLTGAEFLVRGSGPGLYGRYLTGGVGENSFRGPSGALRMAEARVMIGSGPFSVEGGVVLRARASSLAKPRDAMIRLGARSSIWLGPSGFSLSLSGGALGRADEAQGGKKWGLVGWEATTALFYQAPRKLPFYGMLGYRYERIRSEASAPPVSREELSAIVFGVGVRHVGLGGRKEVQPKT